MPQLLTPPTDQRIIHDGRSWEQFKFIQKGFEHSSGVRLFFYNGTIEILMPGREHEFLKKLIGLLIELFLYEKRIEFYPTGSMTQEKEGTASAQPDESYCIGSPKSTPDLSIEVVLTSGGISKLPRYRALEVPEVWFWEDGLITLYCLRDSGYEQVKQSEIPAFATLDFALLTRCVLMAQTSRLEAIDEFRRGIGAL
jgi:Uma2 family endonuclease